MSELGEFILNRNEYEGFIIEYLGGDGSPRELVDRRDRRHAPEKVVFAELVAEPLRQWSIAVATSLVWLAAGPGSLNSVEKCWVDDELAVCVWYSNWAGKFGVRFADVHVSPLSGQQLDLKLHEYDSGTAIQQASNFLEGYLTGGPPNPDEVEWTAVDGRQWWGWGTPPPAGWESVENDVRFAVPAVDLT